MKPLSIPGLRAKRHDAGDSGVRNLEAVPKVSGRPSSRLRSWTAAGRLLVALCALAAAGAAVPVSAQPGRITEFALPMANSFPGSTTTGPDGALWFVESAKIGRITTAGVLTEFSLPGGRSAASIAGGADGLWYTEPSAGLVGRVTTAGSFTEFVLPGNPAPGAGYSQPLVDRPQSITASPDADGSMWFTIQISSRVCVCVTGGRIGRVTPSGAFTEFTLPTGTTRRTASRPAGIAAGPDKALWFTDSNLGKIGRIATSGGLTQFVVPQGVPLGIAAGPDGNLWFTANFSPTGRIGRITTAGVITEFVVPAGANGISLGSTIATGADRNLWFASYDQTTSSGALQRITTAGVLTAFPLATFDEIDGVTAGPVPDTHVWFTTSNNQTGQAHVGEITTS
jgi:virginiamycin B lyase